MGVNAGTRCGVGYCEFVVPTSQWNDTVTYDTPAQPVRCPHPLYLKRTGGAISQRNRLRSLLKPCTLYPIPYTLYLIPYTLYSSPSA